MNKREAYLILLGFITEKCTDKNDEWMLSVALEALYNEVSEENNKKEPLIKNDINIDYKLLHEIN